jgi:hypothetical protein
MHDQLVTRLLPILAKRSEDEFNIFNVMHHGTHEKQISNVFAWLLDAKGTHKLGDAFQRIFVDEVNGGRRDNEPPIPYDEYSVEQEQNTSDSDKEDIADLVLRGDKTGTVLVVENYHISSGHGHSYAGYGAYGCRDGKRGVVVMLCGIVDRNELKCGWQNAAVVTHANLVEKLFNRIERDDNYRRSYPDQYTFFRHIHTQFTKGRRMGDDDLIKFVEAMCACGEARRLAFVPTEGAKTTFGEMLMEQAMERFDESRNLLQRVKEKLKIYAPVLRGQVNAALGSEDVPGVKADYAGIFQWSVGFTVAGKEGESERFQLKFGPSAWYANEIDEDWKRTVPASVADYSCLFITRWKAKEVRQSAVTILEVLDGLSVDDFRLRDEIVRLIRESN